MEILHGELARNYLRQAKAKEASLRKLKESQKQKILNSDLTLDLTPKPPLKFWNVYKEVDRHEDSHMSWKEKRITAYHKNTTSIVQSTQFGWSSSSTFSTNIGVNTQIKKAVKASLGASWGNSYSSSGTITINIAPGKRCWMTYYPICDNSWGIMEDWQNYDPDTMKLVDTLTGTEFCSIWSAKKTFIATVQKVAPDGVYIWREDEL